MKKFTRIFIALSLGIVIMIAGVVGSWELQYRDKIYPGVRMAGIDVGGETADSAMSAFAKTAGDKQTINIVWGANKWALSLEDLGIRYNWKRTANLAITIGRGKTLSKRVAEVISTARAGRNIDPVYEIDELKLKLAMDLISAQVDIPAIEPEIKVDVANGVEVSPGENGQDMDENKLRQRIETTVKLVHGDTIELPITLLRPKLSSEQVETAKRRVEKLVGIKLVLTEPEDGKEWEITKDLWIRWVDTSGDWKRVEIERWVDELATAIDRPAQNASFRFMGGKVEEFRPEKQGHTVMRGGLVNLLFSELVNLESGVEKEKRLEIPTIKTDPEVKTGDVNTLGINELLGKGESWFSGSITNRIFNLKKAADALNGTLVASGETFSFNKTVGEISGATGYKSAYIIKEGKTILGDGGGVCQTSSTLFRAILSAGLPIEERTAHAYRVSYYEQNYQVGFDATVFQPAPDLKFKNDTPAHILIQTEFDEGAKKLTFLIYGTSDGRVVELSKSRTWDVIPAPPDLYIDDPNLPVGKVVQTEHKANGAKVAFDWKVTRGDEVLQERTFYSNYRAWQAVYLRGTKTN